MLLNVFYFINVMSIPHNRHQNNKNYHVIICTFYAPKVICLIKTVTFLDPGEAPLHSRQQCAAGSSASPHHFG